MRHFTWSVFVEGISGPISKNRQRLKVRSRFAAPRFCSRRSKPGRLTYGRQAAPACKSAPFPAIKDAFNRLFILIGIIFIIITCNYHNYWKSAA